MKLSQLLRDVAVEEIAWSPQGTPSPDQVRGDATALDDIEIAEVRDDSRAVTAGDLFVALPGQSADGHRFVADASTRGARAALVERVVDVPGLVQIRVADAAVALARVAANRYDRPASELSLIAVTGTNGKTTTNFLIEALLEGAGIVPGLIGTVMYRARGQAHTAPFTTPTPLLLHRTLREMQQVGVTAVTMEASSHALALDRLHGVRFRVAAFTNLTQDHLDFHGTMERYYAAKAKLFHRHLLPESEGGVAVILVDSEPGRRLAAEPMNARRLTVSLDGPADIWLESERSTAEGITATLRTPVGEVTLQSPLAGRFNLANLAVAVGIGVALGLPAAQIGKSLSRVTGVPGRLERVPLPPALRGLGPSVFVDYAHTPDALERVIAALRPLVGSAGKPGRLIVLFGCGGDRDVGKRPLMGRVAARGADVVVVTSDNPRTEEPQSIIDQITAGLGGTESGPVLPRLDRASLPTAGRGYFVEADRRQALTAAILAARHEDVVLLAGKGHEDYQILGTTRHPFDDREEAGKALLARPDAAQVPPRSSPNSTPGQVPAGSIAATIELPLERVLAATQGKLLRGSAHKFAAVVIDGRAVAQGSLFVAVRGEHRDGHEFVAQAIAAGATGVLVERDRPFTLPEGLPSGPSGPAIIEVADTVVALGQIARAHRDAPEIAQRLRVVAVTGSSGKTTTKDLIAAILTAHVTDPGEVLKTDGNLNNHLGVPLTLLRLRPGQRFAVVEMGMSARGEIAYLASLARPDVGVITNVGPAHLASLGTLDEVAAAKGELFTALPDGAAAVYLGGDAHARVVRQAVLAGATFGRLRGTVVRLRGDDAPAHVRVGLDAETEDGLALTLDLQTASGAREVVAAQLPLLGAHQADNAGLAAAAALALDVPSSAIVSGLLRALPGKHRGQVIVVAGRHVLDDCYNANPASMAAALRTVAALGTGRRTVAVLGDMLELGPTEAALHAQVGEVAAECRLSTVITVGERARHSGQAAAARGIPVYAAQGARDAARHAAEVTEPGDWLLVKGSRGMALETVLAELRALLEDAPAPSAPERH